MTHRDIHPIIAQHGYSADARKWIRASFAANPPSTQDLWKWAGWPAVCDEKFDLTEANGIVADCLERAIQAPHCINSWVEAFSVPRRVPAEWSPKEWRHAYQTVTLPDGLLPRLFVAGFRPQKFSHIVAVIQSNEDYIAARKFVKNFKPT